MQVKIHTAPAGEGRTKVVVSAPYHPDFVEGARRLNGRWNRVYKEWVFDGRDEERVRRLCRAVYGVDGSDAATEMVTVRVKMHEFRDWREVWLCGRRIAARYDRDGRVYLGDGVVVLRGGFRGSGGSRKSPCIAPQPDTVLEVRDVPRALAEAEAAQYPDAVEIVALPDGAQE